MRGLISLVIATLALSVSASGQEHEVAGVALPAVPVAVTDPPPTQAADNGSADALRKVANTGGFELGPMMVEVEPGVTEYLKIAMGHLNRILTPFDNPRVTTSSNADTKIDGRAVYVQPANDAPVTLFISERADPDASIPLTLKPGNVAPREIRLTLAPGMRHAVSSAARRWEESQPYVASLKELLTGLALGQVPAGYSLRPPRAGDPVVGCGVGGVRTQTQQVIEGHHFIVTVALASNGARQPVEFDEPTCYRPGVLAVSTWPRVLLQPGESTELYVVHRRPDPASIGSTRPFLVKE